MMFSRSNRDHHKSASRGTLANGRGPEPEDSPVLKRPSRASLKRNRPHSWHSTLQRGFQRARSRSSGRDKSHRASSSTLAQQQQLYNGKI